MSGFNAIEKLLAPYARKGIVLLSIVRQKNYPLFSYLQDNPQLNLKYTIVDDLKGLGKSRENLKLYIMYHFGDEVNVSEFRSKHIRAYNYITKLGAPDKVLPEMGFKITYKTKIPKYKMHEVVYELMSGKYRRKDKEWIRLYNKLAYQARRRGISVTEYVEYLLSMGEVERELDDD